MTDQQKEKPKQKGRVSLSPLTPDEALAAALQVKPEDMKKLEQREQAKKTRASKKR